MAAEALAQVEPQSFVPDTPSFAKESLYRRYASGGLSLDELIQGVSAVKPVQRPVSRARRIAGIAVAFIAAFLAPASARRD